MVEKMHYKQVNEHKSKQMHKKYHESKPIECKSKHPSIKVQFSLRMS